MPRIYRVRLARRDLGTSGAPFVDRIVTANTKSSASDIAFRELAREGEQTSEYVEVAVTFMWTTEGNSR